MSTLEPQLEYLLEHCHVVSIPLRTRFRGLEHREVMVFEGPSGPGEWAAFVEYDDEEAAWWLAAGIEQAFYAPTNTPWGALVPVNAIVPAMDVSEVEGWLDHFEDVSAVKVKIADTADSLAQDIERLREVQRVVGRNVPLRLDVNGRWGADEAAQTLHAFSEFTIDYVEQPVATLEEMRTLYPVAKNLGIRLAADELIRQGHSVEEIIPGGICDVVIVKPSPLGGFVHTLALARRALHSGLDVVVSSGLETSIGLTHAALLAATLNDETGKDSVHGLGTAPLLVRDVVTPALRPNKGLVSPQPLELDTIAIEGCLASAERRDWWHSRLERTLPRALEVLGYSPE